MALRSQVAQLVLQLAGPFAGPSDARRLTNQALAILLNIDEEIDLPPARDDNERQVLLDRAAALACGRGSSEIEPLIASFLSLPSIAIGVPPALLDTPISPLTEHMAVLSLLADLSLFPTQSGAAPDSGNAQLAIISSPSELDRTAGGDRGRDLNGIKPRALHGVSESESVIVTAAYGGPSEAWLASEGYAVRRAAEMLLGVAASAAIWADPIARALSPGQRSVLTDAAAACDRRRSLEHLIRTWAPIGELGSGSGAKGPGPPAPLCLAAGVFAAALRRTDESILRLHAACSHPPSLLRFWSLTEPARELHEGLLFLSDRLGAAAAAAAASSSTAVAVNSLGGAQAPVDAPGASAAVIDCLIEVQGAAPARLGQLASVVLEECLTEWLAEARAWAHGSDPSAAPPPLPAPLRALARPLLESGRQTRFIEGCGVEAAAAFCAEVRALAAREAAAVLAATGEDTPPHAPPYWLPLRATTAAVDALCAAASASAAYLTDIAAELAAEFRAAEEAEEERKRGERSQRRRELEGAARAREEAAAAAAAARAEKQARRLEALRGAYDELRARRALSALEGREEDADIALKAALRERDIERGRLEKLMAGELGPAGAAAARQRLARLEWREARLRLAPRRDAQLIRDMKQERDTAAEPSTAGRALTLIPKPAPAALVPTQTLEAPAAPAAVSDSAARGSVSDNAPRAATSSTADSEAPTVEADPGRSSQSGQEVSSSSLGPPPAAAGAGGAGGAGDAMEDRAQPAAARGGAAPPSPAALLEGNGVLAGSAAGPALVLQGTVSAVPAAPVDAMELDIDPPTSLSPRGAAGSADAVPNPEPVSALAVTRTEDRPASAPRAPPPSPPLPWPIVLDRALMGSLRSHYLAVSACAVAVLRGPLRVERWLAAVGGIYLHGCPALALSVLGAAYEAAERYGRLRPSDFVTMTAEARAAVSDLEFEARLRPSVRPREGGQHGPAAAWSLDVIESLDIAIEPPEPLAPLFFSPPLLHRYSRAFRFLSALRRVETLLTDAWRTDLEGGLGNLGRLRNSAPGPALLFRLESAHFLRQLSAYVQGQIWGRAAQDLSARLASASDLSDAAAAHEDFLWRCERSCFLTEERRPVARAVAALLRDVAAVCAGLTGAVAGPGLQLDDRGQPRLPAALAARAEGVRTQIRTLVRMVATLADKGHGFAIALHTPMDFNGYFEGAAGEMG